MSDVLDKIAKVLAQAEGTDNEHEADAFLRQAQMMATRHSIDLAVARAHQVRRDRRATPIQRQRTIGVSGAMGNTRMISLYSAIARVNEVRVNIAHDNTYVIAFGFPTDIELVDALFVHLSSQMVAAGNAYLRSGVHKDDAVWDPRSGRWKPVNGRTARLSFYSGWIDRVWARLEEASDEAREAEIADRRAADRDPGETSTALVLADKRAEVEDYYGQTSQARGTWRGTSPQQHHAGAFAAGDAAGRRAGLVPHRALDGGHRALSP